MVETILDEGRRLNRYVQNPPDMTRHGYGALKLRRDWADLRGLIGRAVRQPGNPWRNLDLRLDVPADLPLVHVDPVLIEQVLVNVLDNAAKQGASGSRIGIRARCVSDEIVVTVTNQEPGILPADREKVFDMFYRVRDGQPAGTGLGLAICRGLIEAHGGRIQALAAGEAGGTRIEIVLPMPRLAPSASDTTPDPVDGRGPVSAANGVG